VLGAWAVFPYFLRTQRIHPATLAEWLLLDVLLVSVFVVFGAIGGAVSWMLLRLCARSSHAPLRDPGWATALSVPLALPPLYFLTAAATELVVFGTPVGLVAYEPYVTSVLAGYLLAAILFAVLYLAVVRQRPRPRQTALVLSAVVALGVGLLLVRTWGDPGFDAKGDHQRLRAIRGFERPRPPLLFVGIDSGSWKILHALLEAKRAPVLEDLMKRGFAGEMRATWPHPIWSAPAWGSILTGYSREETGIYQELAATAAGLPPFQIPLELDFLLDPLYLVEYKVAAQTGYLGLTPFPRSALLRQPLWELMHEAGLRVGVVRFFFTYPALGQASFAISDFAGRDAWQLMGISPAATGAVSPPELSKSISALFYGRSPRAESLMSALLPHGDPPRVTGALVGHRESVRMAADIDVRTLDASLDLLRSHQPFDAFFVYLGGFDTICHAFWRYRFPQEFPEVPTSEAEVKELGTVIDRYLEFLDQAIGQMVAAYATPPNVVIVADHGAEPLHGNRTYSSAHSPREGIFLAAGPSIQHRGDVQPVSFLDVTPTVLDLMGFAPLAEMQGTSRMAFSSDLAGAAP
jgi:hypothetical protein